MDWAAIDHRDTYKSQLKKYFIKGFLCIFPITILMGSGYAACIIDREESHTDPLRSIKQLQIDYRNPSLFLSYGQMVSQGLLPIICVF